MHFDAEGGQENCIEALLMAEKLERNLEQKCVCRFNVNTSFPDMWEGGVPQ